MFKRPNKIIEKECHNCGKKIYVFDKYVGEKSTLGCLYTFDREDIFYKDNDKKFRWEKACNIY